ncbi:hypothetical protein, partial [Verminephrobacter aporrectodeae]
SDTPMFNINLVDLWTGPRRPARWRPLPAAIVHVGFHTKRRGARSGRGRLCACGVRGQVPANQEENGMTMKGNTMLDLGPDSKSIRYEVALDILGESRQPFMRAIHEEKQKSEPSQVFIRYCETRLTAIDELQDDLRLNDLDTIERILTKGNPLFKVD